MSGRINGSGAHLAVGRLRVGVPATVFALGLIALLSQVKLGRSLPNPLAIWRSLSAALRFALA